MRQFLPEDKQQLMDHFISTHPVLKRFVPTDDPAFLLSASGAPNKASQYRQLDPAATVDTGYYYGEKYQFERFDETQCYYLDPFFVKRIDIMFNDCVVHAINTVMGYPYFTCR